MTSTPAQPGKHLVLVGGGHAHVFVLEAFARRPEPGLRLTLVARDRLTPYSGMLPGHMAGIYPRQAMQIDLERLARRSGAALVQGEAVAFDRAGRRVLLKSGGALAYDWLSIDIGVTPDLSDIRGADEHALAVKPIGDLLEKWDRLAAEGPRRLAVVGGGVAGICLAFAVRAFLRDRAGAPAHVALIGASLAPDLNAGMRRRIVRALEGRGIALHLGDPAVAVDPGGVTLASGRRIPADAVLVSTRAAPPPPSAKQRSRRSPTASWRSGRPCRFSTTTGFSPRAIAPPWRRIRARRQGSSPCGRDPCSRETCGGACAAKRWRAMCRSAIIWC
jgi:selenide,water dikinase